jgi:hypothetical protein
MGKLLPVSISALQTLFNNMSGRVTYSLGAKCDSLTEDSHDIDEMDCSGFVRFAITKCSNPQAVIPDGSATQHEWFQSQGFEVANYSIAAQQANPGKLFICFMTPETGGGTGHVWFCWKGRTMECYGGHGVGSRPYNASIEGGRLTLATACAACYLLSVTP